MTAMNHLKLKVQLLFALGLCLSSGANASPQLALEYGCFSCHGANQRGEAPSFERLAGKLVKYKGNATELADKVSRYRAGKALEHVDAHERLSPETATVLLRWLSEGGK
jgi:cytochrome c551/c552